MSKTKNAFDFDDYYMERFDVLRNTGILDSELDTMVADGRFKKPVGPDIWYIHDVYDWVHRRDVADAGITGGADDLHDRTPF